MRKSMAIGILVLMVTGFGLMSADAGTLACYQLEPFRDVITLDLTSGAEGVGVWPTKVDWDGDGAYRLTGAGMVQQNKSGSISVLDAVLHNPSSTFFGGNPTCALIITLMNGSGTGPWSFECKKSSGVNPDFQQFGTVAGRACSSSSSAVVEGTGGVAGQ